MFFIRRIPVALAVVCVLAVALAASAMMLELNHVYKTDTEVQAQLQLKHLAATSADLVRTRVINDMKQLGIEGVPGPGLLRQQLNVAAQTFPGFIAVYENPQGKIPVATTLNDGQLTALGTVVKEISKTPQTFEVTIEGNAYFGTLVDLNFANTPKPEFKAVYLMRKAHLLEPFSGVKLAVYLGILLLLIVVVLPIMAGGWLLARQLETMRSAVAQAEQGNKPEPLKVWGFSEAAELASAINMLVQGPTEKDIVRQQANTDALTGLYNRRGLVQAMDDRFKQGGNAAEMSVMFLDLDGFKPINDTYGHDVGDEVLKEVSTRLQTCVRDHDILCRLGGDEFVLMFPSLVDREVLQQRADRVLARVNEPYWVGDSRVTMGVSIGISIGPGDGKTGEELLAAADQAMYSAKKTGKNQFTFYS